MLVKNQCKTKKRKETAKKIKCKGSKGLRQKRTIQTWALKLIRAVKVLQGRVAGGCSVLALQHLSRLRPQGAIVGKGAGRPPLVTGRGIKPIIGKAWEIQYRMGEGEKEGVRGLRGEGGMPSFGEKLLIVHSHVGKVCVCVCLRDACESG